RGRVRWALAHPGQNRERRAQAFGREAAHGSGDGSRAAQHQEKRKRKVMSKLALEKLQAKLGPKVLETHSHLGDDTAVVSADAWHEAAKILRDDPALDFDLFVDLCAVDYPKREPRFEVVLHVYSTTKHHRIRLK